MGEIYQYPDTIKQNQARAMCIALGMNFKLSESIDVKIYIPFT